MKNIAVILSGCGVFDGAEIHEATLTLLAIAKHNCKYICFAPDMNQHHVINHINGDEVKQTRNVLEESARIARGDIYPTSTLQIDDFDALILPGGFGAAKNLSDFAFNGENCVVNSEIAEIIKQFHSKQKPIGAMCISPVILANVLRNVNVSIGSDKATSEAIEIMGAIHTSSNHGEVIVDADNKIVTTPCYMLDASIIDIETGTNKLVTELLKMI
ncbi:isoprenoid biosynthesis glyoxalase ElbB [Labilibacter marinus]|uniref:isoprenoid biosynthesis glyoxalase ElbB n=1 Tax=Labilibacter marinus TaxID=1477105 RepID=UPI00094F5DE6|nr:isoprenoid biosynthesis glyoxalase ElbB [Labilibacter marinus]